MTDLYYEPDDQGTAEKSGLVLCGPGQSEVVDDLSEDELEEVWDMQGKYESVNLWGGPFLAFVDTLVYSVVESVPTEVHGILGFVNERLEFWGSAEGELAFRKAFAKFEWQGKKPVIEAGQEQAKRGRDKDDGAEEGNTKRAKDAERDEG